MDLGAYVQIEKLGKIAEANGIEVPRLRGYRLMRDEKIVDVSSPSIKKEIAVTCVEDLCTSEPFWKASSDISVFDSDTTWLRDYYLVRSKDSDRHRIYTDVRWDRIHGWKRKALKTYIHNEMRNRVKQYEVWNKYVGREDVLYVHARIGGGNWPFYCDKVIDQPWFIEKIDDSFDCTYCDIYAKIQPDTLKLLED